VSLLLFFRSLPDIERNSRHILRHRAFANIYTLALLDTPPADRLKRGRHMFSHGNLDTNRNRAHFLPHLDGFFRSRYCE
jgi:hypothetical protein